MASQDLNWHNEQIVWLRQLVAADKKRHKLNKAEWSRKALAHSKKQLREAIRARRRYIRDTRKAGR